MYFFTATINNWQNLFADSGMKTVITDSLLWFYQHRRASINGFVIMPNHIHLLWQPLDEYTEPENEFMLLSFTGHQFKKKLLSENSDDINNFRSSQNDRVFHFWERRPKTIEVMSRKIAEQKLEYIHNNPLQEKWKLAEQPVDYLFSSARYYEIGMDHFGFMTHYYEYI